MKWGNEYDSKMQKVVFWIVMILLTPIFGIIAIWEGSTKSTSLKQKIHLLITIVGLLTGIGLTILLGLSFASTPIMLGVTSFIFAFSWVTTVHVGLLDHLIFQN